MNFTMRKIGLIVFCSIFRKGYLKTPWGKREGFYPGSEGRPQGLSLHNIKEIKLFFVYRP